MPVDNKLTRGDRSAAAAGGKSGDVAVDLTTFGSATPAGWRQDIDEKSQEIHPPGDTVATVGNQLGGAEEVLNPLENPTNAYRAYRLAPYLEAIIQAYMVNVYSSPYAFQPVINVDDRKGKEQFRANLEYEKAEGDFEKDAKLTDEELEAEVEKFKRRVEREQIFLRAWFRQACTDMPYEMLRMLTCQDRHIQGNAWWEVVRDDKGKPKHLVHAPAWSIRAKKLGAYAWHKTWVRDTDVGEWREEMQPRRFRSYVQLDKNSNVVARYKEFGDPRVMSRKTGRYYETVDDMNEAEVEEVSDQSGKMVKVYPYPATELLQFRIPYSGSSAYGKPRFSSVYPDFIGMRDLSEHNKRIVTDQEIPNILIAMAGARVDKESEKRLTDKLEERAEGPKGVMVLQAYTQQNAPTGTTAHPQIEVIKLRDAMHSDGLGDKYSKSAYKRGHIAYRVPRVVLGDDEGINRSSAFGMFRFVEDQVWDPERDEYDIVINDGLLPAIGIRTVKHVSQGRTPRDPELLAKIISELANAGILTPDEGRELSEQIFNRDFKDLEGIWSRIPKTILNAILQTKNQVTAAAVLAGEGTEGDMLDQLRQAVLDDFKKAGLNVQGQDDGQKQPGAKPGGVEPGADGDGQASE